VFTSDTVWAGGAAPPGVAEKVREAGVTAIDGVMLRTSRLTGMVTVGVLMPRLDEVIVIVPLYAPTASVAEVTVTWRLVPDEPLVGVIDNQLPPLLVEKLAVHVRLPDPVLFTVKLWARGFEPASAAKDSEDAVTPMIGVTDATVNVTETVCGELVTASLEEAMVIVPV
jgi:hypothetical protein